MGWRCPRCGSEFEAIASLCDICGFVRPTVLRLNSAEVNLDVRIRTMVGKALCRRFGADARFVSDVQFFLDCGADGNWYLEPHVGTANETLLNGKKVSLPSPVMSGDIIAVGSETKGIS